MKIPLKVDQERLQELTAVYDRVLQIIPPDGCPNCEMNDDLIVVGTIDVSFYLHPHDDDADGFGKESPPSIGDALFLNYPSRPSDCDWHVDCGNCGYTLDVDVDPEDLVIMAQSLKAE